MSQHHYVPQFYLREFLDPASVGTRSPWLWVADLERGKVSRRSPRNVAKRAGYYSLPGQRDVAETEAIERLFSQMEDMAAPIVRKLNAGVDTVTGQEWADLLYFAAFLALRTPSVRTQFEQFFGDVADMMLKVSASHPAHFAETWQKANPDRTYTPEEIDQMRQQLLKGEFQMRARPILSLTAAFDGVKGAVYPAFAQMRWVILRPGTPDTCFLTSDTPVGWVDPRPRPAFYGGHGLGMPDAEVPVGPHVCLFAGWKLTPGMRALAVNLRIVEQLNRRRVAYSSGRVYAHLEPLAQWAAGFSKRQRPDDRPSPST